MEEQEIQIDVWWRGDDTSRLMLLLAYLVTRREKWESAKIRLLAVNYSSDSEKNREALAEILNEVRISAEPLIVPQVSLDLIKEKCDVIIEVTTGGAVGDTDEEIEIGKKYGFHTIGITGGHQTNQRLTKHHPDFLIHNMLELKKIVQKLNV